MFVLFGLCVLVWALFELINENLTTLLIDFTSHQTFVWCEDHAQYLVLERHWNACSLQLQETGTSHIPIIKWSTVHICLISCYINPKWRWIQLAAGISKISFTSAKKNFIQLPHLIWRWYLVMNHIKCLAVSWPRFCRATLPCLSESPPFKKKKEKNTNYTGTHLEFDTNLHICFSVSSVPVLSWLMGDAYFKICYFLDMKSLMLYIHWCNILRF